MGAAASFYSPEALVIGPDGAACLADADNRRIRRIEPGGKVTTLAGPGWQPMRNRN